VDAKDDAYEYTEPMPGDCPLEKVWPMGGACAWVADIHSATAAGVMVASAGRASWAPIIPPPYWSFLGAALGTGLSFNLTARTSATPPENIASGSLVTLPVIFDEETLSTSVDSKPLPTSGASGSL
jgi:hypothetical protein